MKSILNIRTVHILSLLAIIAVFIIAAIAHIENHKAYLDLPGQTIEIGRCYYKTHFGITCPSCGLTRGFISIENLDFELAGKYNSMSLFVYFLFIFLGIFNILSLMKHCFAKKAGKILGLYGFMICIAIVAVWLFSYFFPLIKLWNK